MRQITEPDNKELRPKEIQPQQRKACNQLTQTHDLILTEMSAAICPPHDSGNRNHGGTPREHIAEPVVNREYRAVPVRDQHHCEIPGNESIGNDERQHHDRREHIHLPFDLVVIDRRRCVTAGHIRSNTFSGIECRQSIKQQ